MTLTHHDIIPLQLEISRIGYVNLTSSWNKADGRLYSSRLYLIEEGSGYLKTDSQTIALEPGYAYLIPAHFKHAYGCSSLKKLYFQFRFTVKDTVSILGSVNQICRIPYRREDLDTLLAHYESTDLVSLATVQQTVLKLVCDCLAQNQVPSIELGHNSPLVKKAIAYIQDNLRINLTIGQISSYLFISDSKLRSAFLAETGITIGQYIDKQVLLRAKQLLANPALSIAQISASLGFCDQFYFSRQFKRRFDMTPSTYRKSILNTNNHP